MKPRSRIRPDRGALAALLLSAASPLFSQAEAPAPSAQPPSFPALGIPRPGPVTAAPYAPQPILPGGIVVPLYPPDSPQLRKDRAPEAERYNMNAGVPGRIDSIVNIHNPSIEVHLAERGNSTGTAVILVAGGAHRTLNVGLEAADLVPWLHNYGVTAVILRNRLRSDGYNAEIDAVHDALQATRLVRAHAAEWRIDPARIGLMGFSAGAELVSATAVAYPAFNRAGGSADASARPDFVALVYPGPTPFTRDPATPVPRDCPPSFVVCAASGDQVHALWAEEYFLPLLKAGVPNIELHLYGRGVHAGGLQDRGGIPFGTWQDRYIDWFRDLGFLGRPGVETKAARDSAAFAQKAR